MTNASWRNRLWLALALLPLAGCPGFGSEEPPELFEFEEVPEVVTFQEHIKPLMDLRCLECHSASPSQGAPATFRLDVLDAQGDKAGLRDMAQLSLIRMGNKGNPMPPTSRQQISELEFKVFERWIDCGKPDTADEATCGGDPNNDPNNAPNNDVPLTYEDTVLPIFTARCNFVGCHGGDAAMLASGLNLETLANLQAGPNPATFIPCDPDSSTLVQRLKLDAGDVLLMPQGGPPLEAADVEAVERWVREGEDVLGLCEEDNGGICGNFEACRQQCDNPENVTCLISCAPNEDPNSPDNCLQCIGVALDSCSEQFCEAEFQAFVPCFQDCRFTPDPLGCIQEDCADERDAFDTCMEPIIRNRNCNEDLLECDVRIPMQ